MRIEDYTTRESHMLLENYLNDATFHVIETLTMERLFCVPEDVLVRETMEESDLLIVGQPEILKETGVVTPQRLREVREKDFFKEFFQNIALTLVQVVHIVQLVNILQVSKDLMDIGHVLVYVVKVS